jgi:aspartyl-tRNA synthetase
MVQDLDESFAGKDVIVRCRLHGSRIQGKRAFITLRERFATVQSVLSVQETEPIVSVGMLEYARRIPKESIIEVRAKVVLTPSPIKSCSQ